MRLVDLFDTLYRPPRDAVLLRETLGSLCRVVTFSTLLVGGDAVEMLDHSSPKITKWWYLDPRLTDRGHRPCDLLPPIAGDADDRRAG